MANISVEDARTLAVTAWDKSTVPDIEKAILKSNLGLNPATAGEVIRIPMPMLTEETRKGFTRQAKAEAESARVSVRNARRDSVNEFVGRHSDLVSDPFYVDRFVLYQSHMGKGASHYVARAEFALAAFPQTFEEPRFDDDI